MATLLPEGKQSFETNAGVPLVGGKVFTYDAGTNNPRATYQDAAATTPNTNPVILDARGEATIFWSGNYKVVLKDSLDNVIWTVDQILSADQYSSTAINALIASLADTASVGNGDAMIGVKTTHAGAIATTQHQVNEERFSVFQYMTAAQIADVISNTGALDVTAAMQVAFNSASGGLKYVYFPAGKYRMTAVVTIPVDVSFSGAGISATNFNQVTANTGGFIWADGSLAYLDCGGFTLTGAGRGVGTSIGIDAGRATRGTFYCTYSDIEVTNFGACQMRVTNGFRCQLDRIYPHGDPNGALAAAVIGLHILGTYAFTGSNYDNRIGYVEGYNNETDLKVENGGKNNFDKVYLYNQLYNGTLHHIWELNSSLNSWFRPHVEPLSLAAGGQAMWLIESTLANPYTYMLGPTISEAEYENGTLGTTVDCIQIGTAAGNLVYNTTVRDGKFMPVSAGKYQINLLNESLSQLRHNTARSNAFPFDRIVRDLTINNPNAATNGSYVGGPFEDSYGTWTPVLYAATSGASLSTLTVSAAKWQRTGKTVRVQMDITLLVKNANTGAVTIRGCEAISPNGGTTVFSAIPGSAIPVMATLLSAAGVQVTTFYAYFNTTNMFINFINATTGAAIDQTTFANGQQFILTFEYQVA